jgi:hypothetical protein
MRRNYESLKALIPAFCRQAAYELDPSSYQQIDAAALLLAIRPDYVENRTSEVREFVKKGWPAELVENIAAQYKSQEQKVFDINNELAAALDEGYPGWRDEAQAKIDAEKHAQERAELRAREEEELRVSEEAEKRAARIEIIADEIHHNSPRSRVGWV